MRRGVQFFDRESGGTDGDQFAISIEVTGQFGAENRYPPINLAVAGPPASGGICHRADQRQF